MAKPRLLMVEDSSQGVELLRRCIRGSDFEMFLEVQESGEEALDYLRECSERFLPDHIIVDHTLPEMDGIELIGEIKSHPHWKRFPVTLAGPAKNEHAILRAYEAGANAYLPKSVNFSHMRRRINAHLRYWLKVAARAPRV